MNEPQEPARTLGDRLVRGALFPLRVTKNSARLIRSALMGDFLTAYSLTQPDKLAMIDDRPDGTVLSLTFSELNAKSNQLANVLLDMGVRPGDSKVVWCGQNSIGLVLMIKAGTPLMRRSLLPAIPPVDIFQHACLQLKRISPQPTRSRASSNSRRCASSRAAASRRSMTSAAS